ncbi:MAG TPA: protein translocase subunit SecD, partial [Candidatus Sulfotelmatobacter sp.]|nr:protein translocase subunit SecD [Candidatus Sulfotelmatobacter sp.]
MNKNLLWKLALIVGILLVFLYGIFGIPQGFSGQSLLTAMTNRIHLGLDLRGGTHLILQVQVNDAVNIDSDVAMETLKEQLNKRKIAFADISKPDPQNAPDKVVIKGVSPDGRKDLLDIVSERLPEYNLGSGADNSFVLTMKPQMLADMKNKAVTQAIETIRNRIDSLGVSEPTIQEHGLGQYQILVQLPGVDDPARVKDIMQSTAMLEIKQVLGGPYASEQAALQEKGGVLPADAILMPGHGAPGAAPGEQSWYLVSRVSAVRGKDLRDAQPSTDQNGQPNVRFTLTGEGGQRFYSFTSAHVGESLGVVLDGKVQEVANIKEAIRDTGEISGGSMNQQQAKDLSM